MFQDKLRELRKLKGISQGELAKILNVSRQSISKYESGFAQPDFDKLLLIAEYFEVSTDCLLSSTKEKQISDISNKGVGNRVSIIGKMDSGKMASGQMSSFYKFTISPIIGRKKHHPEVMLLGIDYSNFWGENKVPLAWYKTREDAEEELRGIYDAIENGKTSYELKNFVSIKAKGLFDFEIHV